MTHIATHRTRHTPYLTIRVVEETPGHVLFRSADTMSLPRDLFDESYVAIRERPFIPREELEEIVEEIAEFAESAKVNTETDIASGAETVAKLLAAVLAKVPT